MSTEHQPALNTDRELWREREGDYYSNSIHVTTGGGIGINVGGHVIVLPLALWFAAGKKELEKASQPAPSAGSVCPTCHRSEESYKFWSGVCPDPFHGHSTPESGKRVFTDAEREASWEKAKKLDVLSEPLPDGYEIGTESGKEGETNVEAKNGRDVVPILPRVEEGTSEETTKTEMSKSSLQGTYDTHASSLTPAPAQGAEVDEPLSKLIGELKIELAEKDRDLQADDRDFNLIANELKCDKSREDILKAIRLKDRQLNWAQAGAEQWQETAGLRQLACQEKEREIERLRQSLGRLVAAMDAMEISNRVWNPFNKNFVRPWPELYQAHTDAKYVLNGMDVSDDQS